MRGSKDGSFTKRTGCSEFFKVNTKNFVILQELENFCFTTIYSYLLLQDFVGSVRAVAKIFTKVAQGSLIL